MRTYKKILLTSLLMSTPLFAFSFDSKLDQLSNTLFDKAVDGVTNSINEEPKKKTSSTGKSKMEQMKELVEMKKQGYITDREFRQQKKIILNQK